MNKLFRVLLTVARGACLDIGQTFEMTIRATSALNAAIEAESIGDALLDDDSKYTHATCVDFIPWGEAASMAAA